MQLDEGFLSWVGKLLPGLFGSAIALVWIKDTPARKGAMFIGGAALSFFATDTATQWFWGNAGLAGFLVGLFGMAVVNKVFEMWSKFNISSLFTEWARKVLGLPPAEDRTQ